MAAIFMASYTTRWDTSETNCNRTPATPCPTDWPIQRLAEARGIVAYFVHHPDSLIILACRAIAAHSPEELERRDALALADLREIASEHIGGLIEGHGRDHRRVEDGLQLHVAAVVGPLQLDHHEVRIAVDAEEVDAPARLVPVTELFRDH